MNTVKNNKMLFGIIVIACFLSCSFELYAKGSMAVYKQKDPFEKIASELPEPVMDSNKSFIDLYWKAWELAWNHVLTDNSLPQSVYMDEAFWENTIWIWDTEFMSMFCKYAPSIFPGVESLRNFYKPMLDNANMPLVIQHPDNPPFYAWIEMDNYKFTDNKSHIDSLINKDRYLQRHFELFDNMTPSYKFSNFKHIPLKICKEKYGYRWDGIQSGMDNTPRGREKRKEMLWIDAISQQALSSLYISRLAKFVGNSDVSKEYIKRYDRLKNLINKYYWDNEDGFYYDILSSDNSFIKVKTPASYWPLLAEIADKKQALRMLSYAENPDVFGGKYPWPSVARNDRDFVSEHGEYWRGGIWVPLAYMATKALEKYGYYDCADSMAYRLLSQMDRTYRNYQPHTIWECYNPCKDEPSYHRKKRVRQDFCGWSALAPISMFIENVLGFHNVDAQKKIVEWRCYQKGRHGIRHLRFGDICTSIIMESDGLIHVDSNKPYILKVNGKKKKVKSGTQTIRL